MCSCADTPLVDRAKNVLSYSQSQVTPLLQSLLDMTKAKRDQAVDTATDAKNTAQDKVNGSD